MDDERDAEYAIRKLDRTEFGRKGRRLRIEWTKVMWLVFNTIIYHFMVCSISIINKNVANTHIRIHNTYKYNTILNYEFSPHLFVHITFIVIVLVKTSHLCPYL